jgi:hypothetical protein
MVVSMDSCNSTFTELIVPSSIDLYEIFHVEAF